MDGILPPCEADEALLRCPVDPKEVKKEEQGTKHQQEGSAVSSGQGPPPHPPPEHVGDEDDWELAMAISASLQQQGVNALMKDCLLCSCTCSCIVLTSMTMGTGYLLNHTAVL